jgi:hypothetical protein
MPILDFTVVLKENEALSKSTSAALAEAAARVFQSEPGRTWVKLYTLNHEMYAEDAGGPPEGVAPIFVSVLKAHPEDVESRVLEAQYLAEAVSELLDRPAANIHIKYEPPAIGRMAFGGELILT